ncbi:MAG: VWA domain-containing protein [Cellvibrionales bacterium]|nr:VWA domain-containing protein [Cellvibrionales bacterium]
MISFETYWFFWLTPLPWLIYAWMPAVGDQSPALRVPFTDDLESLAQQTQLRSGKSSINMLLLAVIWLCLLVTANRPIATGVAIQLPTEARDMMLAVDISGSMEERDMLLNGKNVRRIDTVKHVLSDFTDRRSGDRVGLILFADQAYLQVPLTYDLATVKQLLNEAQLGFAGQKTAIGDAIGLSIKRLIERPNESRTLILLTDGANNAGNVAPLDAAKLAAENAIKIYTIAIGADTIVERSFFGNRTRNPSRDLDETTLKSIAKQTGGQFFRAKNTEDLKGIYSALDKLEPVDQEAQLYRPIKQLFYIPLGIALGTTFLLLLLNISIQLKRKFIDRQALNEQTL